MFSQYLEILLVPDLPLGPSHRFFSDFFMIGIVLLFYLTVPDLRFSSLLFLLLLLRL